MKIKLPTTPEWYAALIFIVGPLFAFLVIEPEWVARLTAIAFWLIPAPFFAFWTAFDPRITLMREDAHLYKRYGKKRVDTFIHVLAFIAGVIALLIMTIPFSKDLIFIIETKAPKKGIGFISATSQGRALIDESIVLEEPIDEYESSFNAVFFSPRHIMQDNTYEFLYLPNTHLILEARLIKEGRVEQ